MQALSVIPFRDLLETLGYVRHNLEGKIIILLNQQMYFGKQTDKLTFICVRSKTEITETK